jgi:AraC-like DNA-binding protein
MTFTVERQQTISPLVEALWHSQSLEAGSFTSLAVSHSELVITREQDMTSVMMRGPETRATIAQAPANAEFLGITFRLGVYLPALPPRQLLDRHANLFTVGKTFWLHDHALPIPAVADADAFVERLIRLGLLKDEPLVEPLLRQEWSESAASARTLQRRFLQATGLSQRAVVSIERARQAMLLLQAGITIADVVHHLGYSDQPHLTKTLRQLVGRTPARIADAEWSHAPLNI